MRDELKKKIRDDVIKGFDYSENISDGELEDEIYKCINREAVNEFMPLEVREELQTSVFDSIRGFDILEPLLKDDEVTEIMVNGFENIFVERNGKLYKSDSRFESEEKLADIIQQIVSGANRTVNEAEPIADAHMASGYRVNVVLPPVALDGHTVTIRKFSKDPFTMEKLTALRALTEEAAENLKKLVVSKYNIFVCGGTGSGKTTFLNALASMIPANERLITIEDSAELQIKNSDNLVRLEVRNKNSGECKEITVRDLIKTSLRMRPDRIIVGEVRGTEALDMLQAMNTGHDGSLSTGHGNSVPDMLDRLETMVLMGMEIPLAAVRKQIASAIDIMIHLGRFRDGTRRVLEITEVLGVEEGEIRLNPLYVFEEGEENENSGGRLIRTGNPLMNKEKLIRAGNAWSDE